MSMFSGLHFQKSPFEVTIRSIKFWHVVADARIEAMAVEPKSGRGVLSHARSVGFHAARYCGP